MSFEKTLLAIAMESGEIVPEQPYDLGGENEDINDYVELVNGTQDEIQRTVALTQSLEAYAHRYGDMEVTAESMESYRFSIAQLFHAAGSSIPVAVICPSFEDASEDKKSIGQKVKGVVDAILKWLRERLAQLGAMFKRLGAKIGLGEAATKKRDEEAKEEIKDLKEAGVKEIVPKADAAADKKPDASAAKDDKSAPAAKPAEKKPVEHTDGKKGSVQPGMYDWMLKDGELDYRRIEAYLLETSKGELKTLIDGKAPDGTEPEGEAVEKFLATDPYTNGYKKWQYNRANLGNKRDYKVDVSQLDSLITVAHGRVVELTAAVRSATKGEKFAPQRWESRISSAKSDEEAKKLRDEMAAEMKFYAAWLSFLNNVRSTLDGIHKRLCAIVK